MKNGKISDRQISASSEFSVNHAAIQARLGFKKTAVKAGSWVSATNDAAQWLQIDLANYYTTITSIATQGRQQGNQWVKMYNLQYSDDEVNFTYYTKQGQSAIKVIFCKSRIKTVYVLEGRVGILPAGVYIDVCAQPTECEVSASNYG